MRGFLDQISSQSVSSTWPRRSALTFAHSGPSCFTTIDGSGLKFGCSACAKLIRRWNLSGGSSLLRYSRRLDCPATSTSTSTTNTIVGEHFDTEPVAQTASFDAYYFGILSVTHALTLAHTPIVTHATTRSMHMLMCTCVSTTLQYDSGIHGCSCPFIDECMAHSSMNVPLMHR